MRSEYNLFPPIRGYCFNFISLIMLVKFISHAINGETYFKTMKVKRETKNRYMEKMNISLLFIIFSSM